MDKKSQVLIVVFALVVVASVVATYYRYVIVEDISYTTDEDAFQASLLEE
jgi:uncharacterized membrane protein